MAHLQFDSNMIRVMIMIPTLFTALFLLLCSPPYFGNMYLFVSAERIRGNSTNDNLTGTPDNDRITGSGGNDTLVGLAGIDEINGDRGIDTISGSEDDDYLVGGPQNDVIRGDEGDDEAEGDDGDDRISGGPGNDSFFGGPGRDNVNGEDGNDNLFGGSGDDILSGGKGKDYFNCGLGKDNVADLNATEGDGKSYNCENQQNISQAKYDINQAEQCSTRVQSFIQRTQDAVNSGEYGEWRSMSEPEIQQLNKECSEQMQGQQ
jgi:RTX calcium-binding nonapeptide repeat (4 copies)